MPEPTPTARRKARRFFMFFLSPAGSNFQDSAGQKSGKRQRGTEELRPET
jgi:hypothetical protein